MRQEIKIVVSKNNLIISILFIFFVFLIRQIESDLDIGAQVDQYLPVLVIVCGSNIIYSEFYGDMKDIFRKLGYKNNFFMVLRRIVIQCIAFFILSMSFYFLFFLKRPLIEGNLFLEYIKAQFAVAVSIVFFSCFTVFSVCVFKNKYVGMGLVLLFWALMTSTIGEKIIPECNVMSYIFLENGMSNIHWIIGKIVAIFVSIIFIIEIEKILKLNREKVKM